MLKLKVGELSEGMIVASDVYVSGINIPVVRGGVVLSRTYIEKIKKHGVAFIHIETSDNYKGNSGESITLGSIEKDVIFEGKVQVSGCVKSDIKIEAGESIIIDGNITEGCVFSSKRGAIAVKGSMHGNIDNPVNLTARQNITMGSASFAIIKTDGDFSATGDIIDTNVVARGEVKIGGKILRGQIQTQSRMVLGGCGSEESGQIMLVVKPLEFQELMQELLKIDTTVSGLAKEKEGLQNIIDLLKKIGKAIDQLPQEMKLEFAKGVKRFKDIEGEVVALDSRKADIKGEIDRLLSVRRIIVNGDIFPGTIVSIGNSRLTITAKSSRLSFCVKDNKITAE
ncbi:MAG TPA: hypothetical protein DHV16_01850 [Nitrospiraceae bacterium]|nr:hypothetical protein [Nitrospiraceae bacterium]